jgi:methyl-accepting chemotaxis protein-2 (aspartate sensor receptor)
MTATSPFTRLSLGWKLSASSIGMMVIVLCAAQGLVSLQVWRHAGEQGDRTLAEAAAWTSSLLGVYDETARRATAKDIGLFKREFDADFTLAEGRSADGKSEAQLLNRGRVVNGDLAVVDGFTQATGAVATVFARTGDDFLRVTTSLKKDDGKRALGTMLDRTHPAYRAMLDGKPFKGTAVLFGKTYGVHYEPIREAGRTIGILFVGTDLTDILQALRGVMKSQHPFGGGSVYAVDLRPGATDGQVFGFDEPRRLEEHARGAELLRRLRDGADAGAFEIDGATGATVGMTTGATTDVASRVRVAYARNAAWNWTVVSEAPVELVTADARREILGLWTASLVAVASMLAMIVWLTRRLISRPVARLSASLTRLAAGDLSQPLHSTSGDELGRLTLAMEGFRRQLASTLSVVRGNAEGVASASAQIAIGNQDLSQRTEVQAGALQETAATMDELNSTVRNNADNARQASELALGASQIATRGGEAVGQVVSTMQGINGSSRRIAEIISVIDSIAFQTNILALNAAVEAARAGEQGRGFAVVATEVRNLAQRSASAAREIKTLIDASVRQVEQGTSQVDHAGATMGEIQQAIARVAQMVSEISSASAEQSTGVGQVGQAVAQMDEATQQNAALVEESAAAAEGLKQQAGQLVEAVAVFRL